MRDQTKAATGQIKICLGRYSLSPSYLQKVFVSLPLVVTMNFDGTSSTFPESTFPELIYHSVLTKNQTAASLLKTLPAFTFAQALVIILAMLEACQYGSIGLPLLGDRAIFKVEMSGESSALLTCHNQMGRARGWHMQLFDPGVSATFGAGTRLFSPTKIDSI